MTGLDETKRGLYPMAISKEQFESLPDYAKPDYAEHEGAYVPQAELKAKSLKSSLDNLDGKHRDAVSKLSAYEQKQAEQQAEAERKALEKLKAEGKVDEILADAERRLQETDRANKEVISKLANQIKTEKRSALVADLAGELATDLGSKAFKALVANRIDVDAETGKVTFLNADGSASALDLAGFKAELLKDDSLSPLLKGNITTFGGGLANGSVGGRATASTGNFGGTREERRAAIAAKYKLPT